jgi:hypothetical protein
MSDIVAIDYYDVKRMTASLPTSFRDIPYQELEGTKHLTGKICLHAQRHGDEKISMIFSDGTLAIMHHHQDCCETVDIEDINGDLEDLLNTPLLVAEEREQEDPDAFDSGTWTFYCLRTVKGSIDIRWYGSSNGFYSEGVSIDIRQPALPLSQHDRMIFAREILAWRTQHAA